MILLRIFLTLFIASQLGTAGEPPKPVCNADNAGDFWPAEANRDRIALARYARSGQLEVCGHAMWRYHWVRLTVRVDQLAKKPSAQDVPEEGETVPAHR